MKLGTLDFKYGDNLFLISFILSGDITSSLNDYANNFLKSLKYSAFISPVW